MNSHRRRPELLLKPCAGVMCELHERCARYDFIEGSRESSNNWLATCADPTTGERVAFIDVKRIGPPHVRQWFITREALRSTINRRPNFSQEVIAHA